MCAESSQRFVSNKLVNVQISAYWKKCIGLYCSHADAKLIMLFWSFGVCWFSPGTRTGMRKHFRVLRVTAVQDKSAQLEHRALPWILPITVTFSSLILTPDLWQTPPQTSPKPWNSKGQVAPFCLENSGASANYFPHWPKGEVMNSTFKDRNHRQMGFSEVTEPGVWSCATGISHSVKPDNLLTTNRCKSQYLKVQ